MENPNTQSPFAIATTVLQFDFNGKSFELDCAFIVGNGVKKLMPIKPALRLMGVTDTNRKQLVDRYNKVIKPAFWAWFNLGLATAKKAMKPQGLRFRDRLDGTSTASFTFATLRTKRTTAAKQLESGEAKAQGQSKRRAKRQSTKAKANHGNGAPRFIPSALTVASVKTPMMEPQTA